MRFTVERDALAEAVAWVARALPTRPVIPVLGGLLLRAGRDGLTLSCFDYEVSARMGVPADVAEPGSVLVPGRLLVEITRSLPGLPVDFADDPDGVSMICGEAAFTLATLPTGEYPELPELPQLAGTADGGATDRYRLAVRELDWDPSPGEGEHGRVAILVPAKTLADAGRLMSPGVPVRIMLRDSGTSLTSGAAAADRGTGERLAGDRVSGDRGTGERVSGDRGAATAGHAMSGDAMIGFEAGERRLTTRLLAGEFIRYRSRFPEEFGCTAELPAEAFAEAVRRVSLVAERGTPVQLSFAPGRVTVGAATQGQARARETVPADFAGDEPVIAFSPHFLLDGVIAATAGATGAAGAPGPGAGGTAHGASSGPDGPRVTLQFTSASKPAVITQRVGSGAGNDFRYLVVPQRVQL